MSIDPTPLVGTWTNTNAKTTGCTQVEIALAKGAPHVTARRAERSGQGAATAYVGPGDRRAIAITARVDTGGARWELEGNVNQGLLVLGCYQTGRDAAPVFSREYFTPRGAATPQARAGKDLLHADVDVRAAGGLDAYVGRWQNADPTSRGVPRLELVATPDGGVNLRRPAPARELACDVYANVSYGAPDGMALRACDDAEPCELQIREVKGVLVVAGFHRADGEAPRFARTFYYRV